MKITSLSANTLFHFTKSIESLESILQNGFYPNYSLENWDSITGDNFQIAIPMVCFCDIPLSQIHNHTNTYGSYALGLTKEWGKRKGINPILYTYKGAASAHHIATLMNLLSKSDNQLETLLKFVYFMKPYEGKLWRDGKLKDGIRFYDEREWRYVPLIGEGELINKYLSPDDFFNEEYKSKEAKKLKNKKLSFEPKDIKYIIVKKESEIYDMVTKVRNIKDKFPYKDVEILITRIISMEHIKEDF